MAEDQIVEEIVLDLKTNWDSELRSTIIKMNKFKDQVSDISKEAVKSYSNFQRQFLSEFGGMSKSTVGEVRVLIGATRRELGELQRINSDCLKKQEGAATQIERMSKAQATLATNRMKKVYAEQEAKLSSMREERAAQGKRPNLGAEKAVRFAFGAQIAKIKSDYIENTKEIEKRAIEPLYLASAKLHAKISQVISSTAQKSLQSVTATTNDIVKQYDKIKNLITFGGQEGKLVSQGKFLAGLKDQFKSSGAVVKDQQARMDQIKAMRKTAEDMLKQARKEDIQGIQNYLKIITDEQKAVMLAMQGTAKQTMVLKDLIKTATIDAVANGARIQQALKAAISPMSKNIEISSKNAFKNLSQMVVSATQGDAAGFVKAKDGVRQYLDELNSTEAELKRIKNSLQAVAGTGFIDENVVKSVNQKIADSLNLIKEQKQAIASTVKDFKELNMQKMMQKTDTSGFEASAVAVSKLHKEYAALGPVTGQNFLQAEAYLKKLESSYEHYWKQRQALELQLQKNSEAIMNLESAKRNTTDRNMVKSYETAIEAMKKKSQELVDMMKATTLGIGKPINIPIDRAKIVAQAKQVATDIQNSVKPEGWLNEGIKKLQDELIRLQEVSKKVGKWNPFKDYKKEVADLYTSLKSGTKSYVTEIANISQQIIKLKAIQKSGLVDSESIGKTISQLQNMQKQFKYANQEFARINNQASKSFQTAMDTTSKGFFKHGMELIRNFRWQYAAVYYIIQNIIGRIGRFVKGTMDEIGAFQKDAASLAAVISMRMLGNIRENYDLAFNYSRGLLNRLQVVATETTLSLEDLTMLTKTFVQAGIIPDTKEDVRKIAAIGMAVKAVTEGMANAGTQMRQELNAVILGRQRASDQLAMMFKFMGINLKKVLQDAKDQGVSLLDALGDALEPFDQMNRKMVGSWTQVSNKASEVWKILKRVGAEDFTNNMATKLNTFLDKFLDNKGELTSLGREVAAGFGILITTIGSVFESIVRTVTNILSSFSSLVGMIRGSTLNVEGMSESLKLALNAARSLMWVFVVMENVTSAIASTLKVIAAYKMSAQPSPEEMPATLRFSEASKAFKDAAARKDKAIADAWESFNKNSKTAEERMQEIDKVLQAIGDKLRANNVEAAKLGRVFKLPFDESMLFENWKKRQDDMKRAKLASMKGPERNAAEYEENLKGLGLDREQLKANISAYQAYFDDIEDGRVKYDEKEYARMLQRKEFGEELLKFDSDLRRYYLDERNKKDKDYYDKETERISRLKKEWNDFLINTYEAPTNEWEKLQKWIMLTEETIKRLQVENAKSKKGFYDDKDAEIAYTEGIRKRAEAISKEFADAQTTLMERIGSYKFKTPFSEIELEVEKVRNDIDQMLSRYTEMDNHTDRMRDKWGEIVVQMSKAKKEMVHLDMLQQNYNANLDVALREMKYWEDAYSPITQRQARINSALIEFSKNVGNLAVEYQKNEVRINEIRSSSNQEGLQYYIEMRENYVRQLEIMRMETERLVWKELHPLWAEMVEMSKSWGDSMTDAMADFIDGTKTAKVAFSDLMKSIQRDVLRATLKKTITEPLMGFLGSGEPGSPTLLQRAMGKGGKEATSSMAKTMEALKLDNEKLLNTVLNGNKPLPVYIVGKPEPLVNAFEEANMSIVDQSKETTEAVDETKKEITSGFSKSVEGLFNIATLIAGGNTSKGMLESIPVVGGLFEQIGGMFGLGGKDGGNLAGQGDRAAKVGGYAGGGSSGGGSWFSNLFSGFGSGSGGAGATGIGEAGMMMAEGGTITEPILGKGMKSGTTYAFGEKTPYGKNEIVSPVDKLSKMMSTSSGGEKFVMHMPVQLNAIDTQSGTDFLMKNSGVLEGNIIRMIRNNRKLRDAMRSY